STPALNPSALSPSWPLAVSISSGRSGKYRRADREKLTPSRCGIIASTTHRSTGCSPSCRSASRPSPAHSVCSPAPARSATTSSRMCGSSSITSTAPIALSCPPRGYARAGKRGVNRRSGPIEPAAPPSPAVQESLAMATTDQSMTASPAPSLPRLERHGSASQLLVDGRPFLVRGGEIGNSSGEPEYLAQHWDTFEALRMNTVVAPVYWDQVEPVEGSFTFSTVDGLIGAARGRGMRLVLLWFGSWKNSMSCYAPAWVKTDPERFPRSRDSRGRALEILTP